MDSATASGYNRPMLTALAPLLLLQIAPVRLTFQGGDQALEPQVVVADSRTVHVAFGIGDSVYVATSRNGGGAFEAPVQAASAGKLALGMRRGPRMAAAKGALVVTAIYGKQGGGRDGDVLSFVSRDGGKTWQPGGRVNDVEGSAREGLHGMASSAAGTVACAWLDLRAKGTRLFVSTSSDGGSTWSKNRLVYESPDGSICECCHPSLAFDGAGKLFVLFRNSLGGARDMFVAGSSDGGTTFASAKKQGSETWKLAACPMDGGMVAGTGNNVRAVWRSENRIFESRPDGPALLLGQGRQPWIALSGSTPYRVWMEGRQIVAKIGDADKQVLSANGTNPVVAASPDGKLAVAAWADRGIHVARLTR